MSETLGQWEARRTAQERDDAFFLAEEAHADLKVENHGTIFLFRPLNEAAKAWLKDNVEEDARYLGQALAVDHGYALNLVDGLLDAGFVLR